VLARSRRRAAARGASLFSGPFARVTVANFFFFLNFASFFLLPLYVKVLGGGEPTVGLVMGTGGAASSAFVFGAVAELLGYRSMFALASLSPAVATVLFYLHGTPPHRRVSIG
jgi:Na+/melibiose symporter-like transporter